MGETLTRHYVTFFSPGTFMSEQTSREIAEWNVATALKMAGEIVERYGARPYGFQFSTRTRGIKDFDSKEAATSGMYYIGGTVRTLADVERAADPDERILLSNMRGNGWDRIITNSNSWKFTAPLRPGDTVLDAKLPKLRKEKAHA